MKSSPGIAALQADPGLQRAAQQGLVSALADWQAVPRAVPMLAEFPRFAAGCDLSETGPLAEQPFGIAPLRHVAGSRLVAMEAKARRLALVD